MPITIQCPGCGRHLQVKDEMAGQRVQCGACQRLFSLPPRPPQQGLRGTPAEARQAASGRGSGLDRVASQPFRVCDIRTTLKLAAAPSIEGFLLQQVPSFQETVNLFTQHATELACSPVPNVGVVRTSYRASGLRKGLGCLGALAAMSLVAILGTLLLADVGGGGAAGALVETEVPKIFLMGLILVAGIVAYYKITHRKKVHATVGGIALPQLETFSLIRVDGGVLTLFPLTLNRHSKPPFFSCNRAIAVDLSRVSAQTVQDRFLLSKVPNMFHGEVELSLNAPRLIIEVINKDMPLEVAQVLRFERPG